ncbi:MAG: hypothetical protein JWM57_2020, partial [Phycisphaerales bacterium]|nr:hypothetical protein [Phycisphaerales bacterium]
MLVSNVPAKVDELDAANSLFLRKDFASARAAYIALAAKEGISPTDAVHAVALCSLQLGDPVGACLHLASIGKPEGDDWRLIASANAQAGHVREAVRAFGEIAAEESAADIQLCEEIAMVSAKRGDKENAWRFYRAVEQVDPGGMAMERLNSSAEFAFANDFFGYGRQSLLNYARGVKDGAIDWGRDSLTGLWQLIRHPVDSVKSFAGAVAQILSKENLKLLLSPTILASKLGSVASRVYWSAWESCKRSAVREYSLELNDLGSQQKIHEIAAGRMVGYVAPDLILLVLSAGAGGGGKASEGRKVVVVATATARAVDG